MRLLCVQLHDQIRSYSMLELECWNKGITSVPQAPGSGAPRRANPEGVAPRQRA